MAFFDKLNDFARNLGDRTNDAIETGKLSSKVSSEKSAAVEEHRKIGEFYYNLFASGAQVAPEVLEFCNSAKTHLDAAAAAQAQIDRIKSEREEKEAAQAAAQASSAGEASDKLVCPSCKAELPAGTKFCNRCGTKLEIPAPISTGVKCPDCGAENTAGTKFCAQCGTKLEVPAEPIEEAQTPKLCPGCGKEVPDGNRFCPECGTKVV